MNILFRNHNKSSLVVLILFACTAVWIISYSYQTGKQLQSQKKYSVDDIVMFVSEPERTGEISKVRCNVVEKKCTYDVLLSNSSKQIFNVAEEQLSYKEILKNTANG